MAKIPLILSERAYIHEKLVADKKFSDQFTVRAYQESNCRRCKNLPNRHDEICESCPNFLELLKFYRWGTIKGEDYLAVPLGNRNAIEKYFEVDYDDALDMRATPKMPHKISFRGKLFNGRQKFRGKPTANQLAIAKAWWTEKQGIIQAAPRTGKTIISTAIGCRLKYRVLVLCHLGKILTQFQETWEDPNLTNAAEVAEENGLELSDVILRINGPKDLNKEKIKRASVVIVNYQKFQDLQRVIDFLRGMFGLVIVDECHRAGATGYARLLDELDAKHWLGLSATPDRRDGRHKITKMLVGPIVARSKKSAILPEITVIKTGISITLKSQNPRWATILKALHDNTARNRLIVDGVLDDLEKGHPAAIIVTPHRTHVNQLVPLLKAELGNEAVESYHAEADQDRVISSMEKGKCKVIVAIQKMIQEGIDVGRPTVMWAVSPFSDWHNFYQLSTRVCTPSPGKDRAFIRILVDEVSASQGCFAELYFKGIHPNLEGNKQGNIPQYKIDPRQRQRILDIAWRRNSDSALNTRPRRAIKRF